MNVHLYRPQGKFGWAVLIWRDNPMTGLREVLRFGTEAEPERWEQVGTPRESISAQPEPTFVADDGILEAIAEAWYKQSPPPAPDPDINDVLRARLLDSDDVRDRLLSIVESAAAGQRFTTP